MFIFKRSLSMALVVFFTFSSIGHSQEVKLAGNVSRPDAHAPITVMGDHVHNKGEWMMSYRYMHMRMSGSKIGHNDVSNARVLTDYMVTPTDMTMDMHMLGLMAAPSDKLTLSAMLPIMRKDMSHRNRAGLTFRTNSEGLGDLKLSALYSLLNHQHHHIHANAGLSFPIGEIDAHDDLPTSVLQQRLPYPMQLGSGTWDMLPGITYTGKSDDWSWGAQALATIRPGRNRIGYALGNEYESTIWGARKWSTWLSQSVGLKYKIWQNIDGQDSQLVRTLVPTADPNSRGGKRLDFLFGLNLIVPKGLLKGHRLAIDFGIPVAQSLDGPQLETDWYFTGGWQLAL